MSDIRPPGLPSPNDEPRNGQEGHGPSQSASGRSHGRPVRSAEECLRALDQLAGMAALGLMQPAQVNAIRGVLHEILAHHQRSTGGSPTAASINGELLERLRQDPLLMNMFAPLLSAEQIAELMKDTTDGNGKS